MPEAQLRLTVNAGTRVGTLAISDTTRAMLAASAGPAMLPTTTSSINSGSSSVRSIASRMATRPSSTALTRARVVLTFEKGVRTPPTTTTSRSLIGSLGSSRGQSLPSFSRLMP